jgi:type IV pilus assembly protein PilW
MTSYFRKKCHCSKRNRGMTLVELMIALAITVVVLAAVGSIYLNSKRSYNVQDDFARMQASALFAFQTLTQDISNAGFVGCNPKVVNLVDTTGANTNYYDFVNGVYGWEYTGTAPGQSYNIATLTPAAGSAGNWQDNNLSGLDPSLDGKVLAGSDILVIKSTTEQSSLVPTSVSPKTKPTAIIFANQTGIAQGALTMVSDCNYATLFRNSELYTSNQLAAAASCGSISPCNTGAAFPSYSAPDPADPSDIKGNLRVYLSNRHIYYIGQAPNKEPALFTLDDKGNPQELVEGVENMQVLYGINQNPDGTSMAPAKYVTYDKVPPPNPANPDMNKVVSIRISLLMRSTITDTNRPNVNTNPCPTSPDAGTCLVGGVDKATAVEVTPLAAKRLYKVFTTTISLRNMRVPNRQIILSNP